MIPRERSEQSHCTLYKKFRLLRKIQKPCFCWNFLYKIQMRKKKIPKKENRFLEKWMVFREKNGFLVFLKVSLQKKTFLTICEWFSAKKNVFLHFWKFLCKTKASFCEKKTFPKKRKRFAKKENFCTRIHEKKRFSRNA